MSADLVRAEDIPFGVWSWECPPVPAPIAAFERKELLGIALELIAERDRTIATARERYAQLLQSHRECHQRLKAAAKASCEKALA